MSKHRIILIASGVVSLLLIATTAAITASGIGKASEQHEEMMRSFNRLTDFFKKDPFPKKENVESERNNLAVLDARSKQLTETLLKGAVVPEGDHTPGSFRIMCEETINKLRKEAPKSENGVAVILPDFNFGFDRYDPKNGVPAEKKDVSRLMCQLKMTEMLVHTLYSSGIMSLETMAREEFDVSASDSGAAGSGSARSGRSSRRGGSSSSTENQEISLGKIVAPPLENTPVPMDRQRFGIVFVAKGDALFRVLNAVNAMSPFAQVSSLQFMKTATDVVFPSTDPEAKQAVPVAPVVGGIKAPPPGKTTRIVSGAMREAPVKVAMTVDIYTMGSTVQEDPE